MLKPDFQLNPKLCMNLSGKDYVYNELTGIVTESDKLVEDIANSENREQSSQWVVKFTPNAKKLCKIMRNYYSCDSLSKAGLLTWLVIEHNKSCLWDVSICANLANRLANDCATLKPSDFGEVVYHGFTDVENRLEEIEKSPVTIEVLPNVAINLVIHAKNIRLHGDNEEFLIKSVTEILDNNSNKSDLLIDVDIIYKPLIKLLGERIVVSLSNTDEFIKIL